jgi:hypothetical protein
MRPLEALCDASRARRQQASASSPSVMKRAHRQVKLFVESEAASQVGRIPHQTCSQISEASVGTQSRTRHVPPLVVLRLISARTRRGKHKMRRTKLDRLSTAQCEYREAAFNTHDAEALVLLAEKILDGHEHVIEGDICLCKGRRHVASSRRRGLTVPAAGELRGDQRATWSTCRIDAL